MNKRHFQKPLAQGCCHSDCRLSLFYTLKYHSLTRSVAQKLCIVRAKGDLLLFRAVPAPIVRSNDHQSGLFSKILRRLARGYGADVEYQSFPAYWIKRKTL
jgi:hypothetical protein